MNPRDIKKLTDFLKSLKQIGQIQKLTRLLKQIREMKLMTHDFERRQWVEKYESSFQGLSPADWAWLKEKADYDQAAWEKIVKDLGSGGKNS